MLEDNQEAKPPGVVLGALSPTDSERTCSGEVEPGEEAWVVAAAGLGSSVRVERSGISLPSRVMWLPFSVLQVVIRWTITNKVEHTEPMNQYNIGISRTSQRGGSYSLVSNHGTHQEFELWPH